MSILNDRPNKHLMCASELASYLRVSPSSIYRMVDDGLIPYFLIRQTYRFDLEDVLKVLEVKND